MKQSSLKLLLFLSVFAVLQACTVQKRLYRPGYHIEWKHTPDKISDSGEQDTKQVETESAEEEVPEIHYVGNESQEEENIGFPEENANSESGTENLQEQTDDAKPVIREESASGSEVKTQNKRTSSPQTISRNNKQAKYWSSDQKILAIVLLLLITIALLLLLGYWISVVTAADFTTGSVLLTVTLVFGFIGVVILFFVILSAFLLRPSSSQVERREARLKQREEQEAKQQAQEEKRLEKLTPEERQAEQVRKENVVLKKSQNNTKAAIFLGIVMAVLAAIVAWNIAK